MATGMLSNRNEDESSQQTNSNSSEFMNCPQCQLEFNSPQVCQHVNYFNYFLSFHIIFYFSFRASSEAVFFLFVYNMKIIVVY